MTNGNGEGIPHVPYEYPPEAGYDWPPVQWMPPYVYDHEIDYGPWLEGAPPEVQPI
jgi:hypothetical protein